MSPGSVGTSWSPPATLALHAFPQHRLGVRKPWGHGTRAVFRGCAEARRPAEQVRPLHGGVSPLPGRWTGPRDAGNASGPGGSSGAGNGVLGLVQNWLHHPPHDLADILKATELDT